jgi:hypothetical protein
VDDEPDDGVVRVEPEVAPDVEPEPVVEPVPDLEPEVALEGDEDVAL